MRQHHIDLKKMNSSHLICAIEETIKDVFHHARGNDTKEPGVSLQTYKKDITF